MMQLRRDRAYYLYRYGTAILHRCPRRLAHALMRAVGLVAWRISSGTRGVVEANLRQVVGPDLAASDLSHVVRDAFVSYAEYWADLAGLERFIGTDFDNTFEPENLGRYRDLLAAGGSVIALPHLGSWEIAGLWAHERGHVIHTVAEPSSNDRLTDWFNHQRESLGLSVYPLGAETVSQLLAALERDETVALIADRDVAGDGVEVEFFGRRTRMPGGPALLALRSGRPLVPAAVYCDGNGGYVPYLDRVLPTAREGRLREDVERITQDLAHAFEGLIRRAPTQWHVFQPVWTDPTPVHEVS